MPNQTISDRLRSLALGILNGAIYSAVQFILLAGYYNYLIKLDADNMERRGLSPVQMTDMINKRLVSFWFVLGIYHCQLHRASLLEQASEVSDFVLGSYRHCSNSRMECCRPKPSLDREPVYGPACWV